MPKLFSKAIPILLFWGLFFYAVFKLPYPESFTQANFIQLIAFFIPGFLALALTINLLIKNLFSALSISLGLIFLLILKALDSLNLVTGILILTAVFLLVSYFRKVKKRSMNRLPKIPKLTNLQRRTK